MADKPVLPARVLAEVHRILDREARRILEEELAELPPDEASDEAEVENP